MEVARQRIRDERFRLEGQCAMKPDHDHACPLRLPDVDREFPKLPICDYLSWRQSEHPGQRDSGTGKIISAAIDCLTSVELLGEEIANIYAANGLEFINSDHIDRHSRTHSARICLDCQLSRCVSSDAWDEALFHVADRSLSLELRRDLVRRLRCRRRVTQQVLDQIAFCVAPVEHSSLRLTAVMVLSVLGQSATSLVPRLLEMYTCEEVPGPELDSCEWRRELCHALVNCLTEGQDDAWALVQSQLDYNAVGIDTATMVIFELQCCRAYEPQISELLCELTLRERAPLQLRCIAAHSLGTFPDLLGRYTDPLCELFCAEQTPRDLREELLRLLRFAASPDNHIASVIARVAMQDTAPESLRLRSLWSFRRMAPELRHEALRPALARLSDIQTASVADISFLMTASTFWNAGRLLDRDDEDHCLRILLLAAAEARIVGSASGSTELLAPRRFLNLAVGSEWLGRALGQILRRRGRAFLTESRVDLMQSLYYYLIELLGDNTLKLPTTAETTLTFHRRVVDRVDSRARHRFWHDHAVPDYDEHGRVSVTRIEDPDGLIDLARSPVDVAVAGEMTQCLHELLEADLSPLERELLWRFRVEGQTLDALAAEFGRSRDQIWRSIQKAEKSLRRSMSRLIA